MALFSQRRARTMMIMMMMLHTPRNIVVFIKGNLVLYNQASKKLSMTFSIAKIVIDLHIWNIVCSLVYIKPNVLSSLLKWYYQLFCCCTRHTFYLHADEVSVIGIIFYITCYKRRKQTLPNILWPRQQVAPFPDVFGSIVETVEEYKSIFYGSFLLRTQTVCNLWSCKRWCFVY